MADKYYQVPLDGVDSQPVVNGRWFKASVAIIGGSCLVLLSIAALSTTTLHSTSADESTNLIGMSPSLRMNAMQRASVPELQGLSKYGTGLSGMKKYAMAQMASNIVSNQMRGVSMRAEPDIEAVAEAKEKVKETMDKMDEVVALKAKDMPGVTGPLGFFDPLGFSADCSAGKLRFYREVELKHGRVGMLASLGFLVGENFHPLFGGNIDVPSYLAFQQTPLQQFWPAVLVAISIPETFSIFTFNEPAGPNGGMWTVKADHVAGDLGFDPLGLKPKNAKDLLELQNKELNNGRLAMLAAAGMIAQELVSGKKIL